MVVKLWSSFLVSTVTYHGTDEYINGVHKTNIDTCGWWPRVRLFPENNVHFMWVTIYICVGNANQNETVVSAAEKQLFVENTVRT